MKHPLHNDELNEVPKFAILQNSKTKESAIWNGEKWVVAPLDVYEMLGFISKILRVSPNPEGVME